MGRPKKDYPPIEKPTLKDIIWLAGFYEGEGCAIVDMANQFALQIGQVNTEPMIKIERLFGGKIYPNKTLGQVIWWVKRERALGIALTLYGLLSQSKRIQILSAWQRAEVWETYAYKEE